MPFFCCVPFNLLPYPFKWKFHTNHLNGSFCLHVHIAVLTVIGFSMLVPALVWVLSKPANQHAESGWKHACVSRQRTAASLCPPQRHVTGRIILCAVINVHSFVLSIALVDLGLACWFGFVQCSCYEFSPVASRLAIYMHNQTSILTQRAWPSLCASYKWKLGSEQEHRTI